MIDHGDSWKAGAEIVGIPYNAGKADGDLCPDENQVSLCTVATVSSFPSTLCGSLL